MNPGERRDLSKRPFINNNPEETDVSAKEFNAAVRNAEQGVADTPLPILLQARCSRNSPVRKR